MAKLKKLRFYAEREKDGSWFGICIDLNISARADSFDEIRAKLHAYTLSYLEEAVEEDREYVDDLIPRAAPLYFRVRYYWLALRHKCRLAADHLNACRFTEEFPRFLKAA